MMESEIKTNYGTDEDEFARYVGRKPKDQAELDEYARLCKKGMEAQLDWNMINECAAEHFGSLD